MQNLDNLELRSPETKEIVSAPPHWLVKWSITIISLFFIALLFILYFIKVPVYINNIPIIIYPQKPIKNIYIQNNGFIQNILVSNDQKVNKDQPLLIIDSDNGDAYDILQLEKFLTDHTDNLNRTLLRKISDKIFDSNIRKAADNFCKALQVNHITIPHQNDLYNVLLDSIREWKKHHILISPVEGIVKFEDYLYLGQYIEKSIPLIIIPANNNGFIGVIQIDRSNSAKIQKNSRVTVKIKEYPVEKYGELQGRIANSDFLITGDKVFAEVYFPNGLVTDQKVTLSYIRNLTGVVEIEGGRERLLYKIFN